MAFQAGNCTLEEVAGRMYLHAVAIPPTLHSASLGPRVEHILVGDPGRLSEVIANTLSLPQARSNTVAYRTGMALTHKG